jgi:hypothetical protein
MPEKSGTLYLQVGGTDKAGRLALRDKLASFLAREGYAVTSCKPYGTKQDAERTWEFALTAPAGK